MKSTLLALAALAFSSGAFAKSTPSQSIEQFCADRSSPSFVKNLVGHYGNLMAFRNQGGLANGGVCWWHSRFQRNALYLSLYKPAEARPSKAEAQKIIGSLRSGKEFVVIPGFRNFYEFSYVHADLIQRELEKWQKSDGIAKFNWVIGLSGSNVTDAATLKNMMDELFLYVEGEGNIAYQRLQIKGITAHAWLVVKMKAVKNGYDLEVLDSNMPNQTMIYKYREGQKSFMSEYYGEFVPYLERKAELETVQLAVLKECNPEEYEAKKAKAAAEAAALNRANNEYSGG